MNWNGKLSRLPEGRYVPLAQVQLINFTKLQAEWKAIGAARVTGWDAAEVPDAIEFAPWGF